MVWHRMKTYPCAPLDFMLGFEVLASWPYASHPLHRADDAEPFA